MHIEVKVTVGEEQTGLHQHHLFQAYNEARARAEKTGSPTDAIEAGRRWAAFLKAFT